MIYLLQFRINRNIVECKFKPFARYFFIDGELIETLWNVNSFDRQRFCFILRINRNIVECKYKIEILSGNATTGINRNIVECKLD